MKKLWVRRMLWEIIRKNEFAEHVQPDRIFFFSAGASADGLAFTLLEPKARALPKKKNAIVLTFTSESGAGAGDRFNAPTATLSFEKLEPNALLERLRAGNRRDEGGARPRRTVVLTTESDPRLPAAGELLRGVLALKRILELNNQLPLTLRDFHVGEEIIFPTVRDLEERYHLVDRKAAQLFYEVADYYLAFQEEYNHRVAGLVPE